MAAAKVKLARLQFFLFFFLVFPEHVAERNADKQPSTPASPCASASVRVAESGQMLHCRARFLSPGKEDSSLTIELRVGLDGRD